MAADEPGYDEVMLINDLKGWWDDEVAGKDDPFAPPKKAAGTIFDALPDLDSLSAVTGLVAIEKHVPFKIPVRIIRRGGYTGFDDLVSDLIPKLRALAKQHRDKEGTRTTKQPATEVQ